jgi:hypothetical protein
MVEVAEAISRPQFLLKLLTRNQLAWEGCQDQQHLDRLPR